MFLSECCRRWFWCFDNEAKPTDLEMIKDANTLSEVSTECTAVISMDEYMSAPTVAIDDSQKAGGTGLALCGVNIEQDAVYWEWHIEEKADGDLSDDDDDNDKPVMFGVSTKRNPEFYKVLAASGGGTPMHKHGTKLMRVVDDIEDGDTIGVAFQIGDAPTIQLLKNGHTVSTFKLGRYRGDVYPSIWLPGKFAATIVSSEDHFREVVPHPRFQTMTVARRLV